MKHGKIARIRMKSGRKVVVLRPVLRKYRETTRPEPVPESLAGQYVVWSADGLRIKGHGRTIAEARAMAGASPTSRRVIQKIPAVRRFRPAGGAVIRANAGPAEVPTDPAEV